MSTNEVVSDDLDLNSDAVPHDDDDEQNEISRGQVEGSSLAGEANEVRVFVDDSGEVAVSVGLVDEGLEREAESVDGGADLKVGDVFDESVSRKVGVLEDEDLGKVGCSMVIAELPVEEVEVVVGKEVAVMDSKEVPIPADEILGTDALNGSSSCLENDQSLGADAFETSVIYAGTSVERTVEFVDGGADVKAGDGCDALVSREVGVLEDEDLGKVGYSTVIAELPVEEVEVVVGKEVEVVVGKEVAVMDSKGVPIPADEVIGTDVLNASPSCLENDQSLEVDTGEISVVDAGTSVADESLPNGDFDASVRGIDLDGCALDSSVQCEKRKINAQVAETLSSTQVAGYQGVDSLPAKEIPKLRACVIVDSNSAAEVTEGNQVVVVPAASHGVGEADSAADGEQFALLPGGSINSEAVVAGGCVSPLHEKHSMSIHVSELGSSGGMENHIMEVELEVETRAAVAESVDGSQAVFACVSSHGVAEADTAGVSESARPFPGGNPDPKVQVIGKFTSSPHSKQNNSINVSDLGCAVENETIKVEVEAKAAGGSCKSDENHIMLDDVSDMRVSNSIAKANNGSQAAVACVASHIDGEADSAEVGESVQPLPGGNPDFKVQVVGDCTSSPHDKQRMGVNVSELGTNCAVENENMEVEVETQAAGGSCKPDENQIMLHHASDVRVSNSIAELKDESETPVTCAASHGEDGADSAAVSESLRPLLGVNPDAEVHVIGECSSSPHDKQHTDINFSELDCAVENETMEVEVEVETQVPGGSWKSDENHIKLDHVSDVRVSNSIVKLNEGFQAAVAYAASHSEGEADSTVVSESVQSLPGGSPDPQVQVVGDCVSSPCDKQNTGVNVSQVGTYYPVENESMEAEVETQAADGSCKSDENHIMLDHVSDVRASNTIAEPNEGSEVGVSCADSHSEGETDSAGVGESVRPLPGGNSDSEVQVVGDCVSSPHDKQNMGTNVSEVGIYCAPENETMKVEHETQAAGGSCKPDENHIMLNDVSDVRVSNSIAEINDGSQAAVTCAAPHIDSEADSAGVGESLQPLPVENETMEIELETQAAGGSCKLDENHILLDNISDVGISNSGAEATVGSQAEVVKQNMGINVSDPGNYCAVENETMEIETQAAGGSNKLDEYHILLDHVSDIGIPNSVAEAIVGSQAEVECAASQREGEADSAHVGESVGPLPGGNPDLKVEVDVDCASSPHGIQNINIHVSESGSYCVADNQTMEVPDESQAVVGSCKLVENQTMLLQVCEEGNSQPSGDNSNVATAVVVLDTGPGTIENQKTGDEVVKEDTSPLDESHIEVSEVKEVEGYVAVSGTDCSVEKSAEEATEVCSDGNQDTVEKSAEEATEVCSDGNQDTDIEQLKNVEKNTLKWEAFKPGSTSVNEYTVRYRFPLENGDFSVSDLVWGKVKHHPWWPGQIFDPSDSSEQAIKYHRKDSFLVAYFGDQTFAWNEASLLRPFRTHFSLMEKQSNVEAVRNAVGKALDEVSRRVKLGLACSCMPEEAYASIKYQIIENTGIREESSRRDGVDKSLSVSSFQPDKLVEYIKGLALFPSGGSDRLELVIAEAQLLSFYSTKGYVRLPEFQVCGGLMENDTNYLPLGEGKCSQEASEHATPVSRDEEQVPSGKGNLKSRDSSSRKRKHYLEDNAPNNVYPSKKERSLSELMAVEKASTYSMNCKNESDGKAATKWVSQTSGKKRKAIDSIYDDQVVQNKKGSRSASGVTDTESPRLKQSFKVGESICRVASQLTGSSPILKFSGERFQKSAVKVDQHGVKVSGVNDGVALDAPIEYSSPDTMLSQLCLAALDPLEGYNFLSSMVSFFSDFRNSISIEKPTLGKHKKSLEKEDGCKTGSRNKKPFNSNTGFAETFMFDDMKDSYWTDMVIQSSSEEQSSDKIRNGKGDFQLEEQENSLRLSPMLEPVAIWDEKPEDKFSPTALILSFIEGDSVPSETNLNKIFRRFGPLKESETEVLSENSCARVVFKRRSDAEVAFSSAGRYRIFGPSSVSYQLMYFPSLPSRTSFCATENDIKDAATLDGNTA